MTPEPQPTPRIVIEEMLREQFLRKLHDTLGDGHYRMAAQLLQDYVDLELATLKAELAEANAGLEMGQRNCDAEYDRLRAERDAALAELESEKSRHAAVIFRADSQNEALCRELEDVKRERQKDDNIWAATKQRLSDTIVERDTALAALERARTALEAKDEALAGLLDAIALGETSRRDAEGLECAAIAEARAALSATQQPGRGISGEGEK